MGKYDLVTNSFEPTYYVYACNNGNKNYTIRNI